MELYSVVQTFWMLWMLVIYYSPDCALGIDVHITDSELPGRIIFNTFIEENWIYSMAEESSSQAKKLVILNDNGKVLLQSRLSCDSLIQNPVSFFIHCQHKTLTNRTELPINVHIHGQNCYMKHRRKDEMRESNLVTVSINSHKSIGDCFIPGDILAPLRDHLPLKLTQGVIKYRLENNRNLYINSLTGVISTNHSICLQEIPLTLLITLESLNDKQRTDSTTLLQVIINPKIDSPSLRFQSEAHNKIRHRHKSSKRLKRATNTRPRFQKSQYVDYIKEEQNPGLSVITISAQDPDSGQAGTLTYSLEATSDRRSETMFTIDPTSGYVSTVKKLDRESMDKHYFQVIATDNGSPPLSAITALTIYVDDVNDHTPEFENPTYAKSISESRYIGSTVLTVRATDGDFGSNSHIKYSILNPSGGNEAFLINEITGSITTRRNLDRETQDFYKLVIQAHDDAEISKRRSSTAEVEITVLDENDNYPQFTQRSYNVEVSESIDPALSPVIAEISATDKDDGSNARLRYSITGGNSQDMFGIDSLTGDLSILTDLDFENTRNYRLVVRAQDGGSPSKSNSTNVLVRVKDENDNTPRFLAPFFRESVLESVDVGHSLLHVQAFDSDSNDNSALIYTIVDPPQDMPLEINRETGWIVTNGKLDRETTEKYSFHVEAKDQGIPPLSASTSVIITIRDVNDNAPVFSPNIYHAMVSEEDYPPTLVETVTATDQDEGENGRVTYDITAGNDRRSFDIVSNYMGQGQILLAKKLDFKRQSRYILTIVARDVGDNVDTATVFINVSDANTKRPVFRGTPYRAQVDEDVGVGTSVFTVSATDGDSGENARITYSLDSSNTVFRIDENTGVISTREDLDRETTPGYTVSVTATDNGRPRKSDTTDVEIVINDVNDNSPEFSEDIYMGRIPEDAAVGTSVLTVTATDRDSGNNEQIYFTFENGNDGNGDFTVEPTLGIVRTAKHLDRERQAEYELKLFANDNGIPMKSSSVIVRVTLDDINDNAPAFDSDPIDLYIKENSPIGSTVDNIVAVDPDVGENAKVEYKIVGGEDANLFSLVTNRNEPAVLITETELDYEGPKREYKILVHATSNHLFSEVDVIIHVQDINDNVPQLQDFTIVFNNYKNHFPTSHIGRVPAFDPDVNDELKYRFISKNAESILHLEERTGLVKLDPRLNSDVPRNGTFQVSVSDGINEVKAICSLFVRLVTEDMLFNSITVRLNDTTQTHFLSPVYNLFLDALSHVIPAPKKDIFIINIREDTDVMSRILNVSFSVREKIVESRDVFRTQQYLRERVYLQRGVLAQISQLEVLPFDDNLCVREPCFKYEECLSILKFGNASDFIFSPTMLFRPIHPISAFECRCPEGFTGSSSEYLCDTEVNLCYSKPCNGNGSCIRREGGFSCQCADGFAGDNCQVDTRHDKCNPDENVCRAPSQCVPLISGGFRCDDCPDEDYYNDFCDLTTRSFSKGSFLLYESMKQRHRFKIQLQFATQSKYGLLFYNGRYNGRHDFIALEIIGGQVQFAFSLGSEMTRVKTNIKGGVNTGEWTDVSVSYLNKTVTLSVGADCDTEISLKYGDQLGNYSCAARATQTLDDVCKNPTKLCHRFLDLTGPLHIGAVPNAPTDFQVLSVDYEGCMRDLYIDNKFVSFDDYVWNTGTQKGCPSKRSFCAENPCKNGGICKDVWGTYVCECKSRYGGKDCTQEISEALQLDESFIAYDNPAVPVISQNLVWYNGLSFRTWQTSGLLMQIQLGNGDKISIEIVNGYIHYIHPEKTAILDSVTVNDGQWHYMEARWYEGDLKLELDYGHKEVVIPMGDWVVGQRVVEVYVGGVGVNVGSNTLVQKALQGCVKNIQVGNEQNSMLRNPRLHRVESGCDVRDTCESGICPKESVCMDRWQRHECMCYEGHTGPNCSPVCSNWNPCTVGSECKQSPMSSNGYTCECDELHSGQYCEDALVQPCPSSWWGYPICGPCNCPKERGFDPACNKTTGVCHCKANHYRPSGSDTCFPCDCYWRGSDGRSCDPVTGQCLCKAGVIGRRCDTCSSVHAEVTSSGCVIVYDECPLNYAGGIWWQSIAYNSMQYNGCPPGTIGQASRYCDDKNGWGPVNNVNCTSRHFAILRQQLGLIETGLLKVNTFLAKELAEKLNAATEMTKEMYGADVTIAYRLITQILLYENKQTGLNLTHAQDRNFIQNIINSMGRIVDVKYASYWHTIHETSGGAVEMMQKLEQYVLTLAKNIHAAVLEAFDSVHDNIVLGLDFVDKNNFSGVSLPKYNNKVVNDAMFDQHTTFTLPQGLLKKSANDWVEEIVNGKEIGAVVGYVMYRTLGDILPKAYQDNIRVGGNQTLNAPIVSITVLDGQNTLSGWQEEPIILDFKQKISGNRSSPQCMYWKFDERSDYLGRWTSEGCEVTGRREEGDHRFVTCSCKHLSNFGLLMDVSAVEYMPGAPAVAQMVTYAGISLSVVLLVIVLFVFLFLMRLGSNANTIHLNLVFTMIVSQVTFVVGIYKVDPALACKIISIILHFFFMSTFAWMFVEALHIYRMMTEIRNINVGSMKFYFVIAYVIPGIIVGLAVGLSTDGYGTREFCWLSTRDLLIWSFAGPICLCVLCNIVVFVMALKVACCDMGKEKAEETEGFKSNMWPMFVLLPILSVTWVFGLLAVNENIDAFHYIFAIVNVIQATIILVAYVILNKRVRRELHHSWLLCRGKPGIDDTLDNTHVTRSAMAYTNDSSLDGGLHRINIGMSTTSTTSRSTSKTGSSREGRYLAHSATSTSTGSRSGHVPSHKSFPNAGIPPYGYDYQDSSMFHNKPPTEDDPDTGELQVVPERRHRDSDSDSDLSNDLDLASSHSSDEDDDPMTRWDLPKNKMLEQLKSQTPKQSPVSPSGPAHSTPLGPSAGSPPPYASVTSPHQPSPRMQSPGMQSPRTRSPWAPADPYNYMNEADIQDPEQIKTSYLRSSKDQLKSPESGGNSPKHIVPPRRIDSLPSPARSNKALSKQRIAVQVLTHNGSISSESENSNETSV
ncbi:unnamed protein product [Owenia fusiformis]|uniref:Protocadherin-like wing polarity protein stan n=1 Tax=Owenia fusiformis TaxID=6347 RepID=A0A8S4NTU8_OWEFU|nr:unnamed protein product [Owenia fusiformis]